jgi:GLPGLI family protein
MKKNSTLFFSLLFSAISCYAQVRVTAVSQQFQTLPAHLPAADTLDSPHCMVYYRYFYPVDNFNGGFSEAEDRLTLQIGRTVCKTFSHDLHLWDRNLTYGERNKFRFRTNMVDYEIFRNYPTGRMTVQHRIPYSRILQGSTQVVEYSEPVPQIEWTISGQTDSVGGYRCIRADGRFGGRDWRVWFAPDLPFAVGPWKLGGLPGLILRVEDASGDYRFEFDGISTEAEPIVCYDWRPVKMSKAKWQKIERRMYEHPMDYFSKNGEIKVLDMKTHQPLDGEWKVRYNPLELE